MNDPLPRQPTAGPSGEGGPLVLAAAASTSPFPSVHAPALCRSSEWHRLSRPVAVVQMVRFSGALLAGKCDIVPTMCAVPEVGHVSVTDGTGNGIMEEKAGKGVRPLFV